MLCTRYSLPFTSSWLKVNLDFISHIATYCERNSESWLLPESVIREGDTNLWDGYFLWGHTCTTTKNSLDWEMVLCEAHQWWIQSSQSSQCWQRHVRCLAGDGRLWSEGSFWRDLQNTQISHSLHSHNIFVSLHEDNIFPVNKKE